MLTPICVPCRLQMKITQNHCLIRDPEAASGPSTYWLGDEYECPQCGARIVTGFGAPMHGHPGARFGEALEFRYELPAMEERVIPDEEGGL